MIIFPQKRKKTNNLRPLGGNFFFEQKTPLN
jgi:hypothetical protein